MAWTNKQSERTGENREDKFMYSKLHILLHPYMLPLLIKCWQDSACSSHTGPYNMAGSKASELTQI